MAPFSILSSYRVMDSSNICSYCPLNMSSGAKMRVPFRKVVALGNNHRDLSSSAGLSCSFLSDCIKQCHYTTHYPNTRNLIVASKSNGIDREEKDAWGSSDDKPDRRKKFSLRASLRLLLDRVRMFSFQSLLREVGAYLQRNSRRVVFYTLISVAMSLCFMLLSITSTPSPKAVPYSDFITSLQGGTVSKVLFEEGSRHIFYNTISEDTDGPESVSESALSSRTLGAALGGIASRTRKKSTPEWKHSTRKIEHDESFLLTLMREKGTTYSSAPQSVLMSFRSILITVVSLWIPLTPLMWLLHRQLSGGNNPAKKRRPTNQMVCFDDVEGVDAAKEELMEIVSCLQGSINYNKLGAKLPRGVLLVGPPGTGKTLLARAVAGEAGVPFFSVSASEFVEMFVGRGASRIRDLFNVARKCEPSIVFIDELDAVGGKRGRSFNDERDQTLNQLLTEMDGFESGSKVIVIAATNRPEALDPALCRPGRFSRRVLVGEPNLDGRKKILAVHFRGVPLEEDSQLICNLVATLTSGFVGADLANIVNEAALLAARRGGDAVSREDVMMAIERAKFGINERQFAPGTISRGIGKLFPWMPSLVRRDGTGEDGFQGITGYQTLS